MNTASLLGFVLSAVLSVTAFAEVHLEGEAAVFDGAPFTRADTITLIGVRQTPEYCIFSAGKETVVAHSINGRANQDKIEFHLLIPGTDEALPGFKNGEGCQVTGHWVDCKLQGVSKIFTLAVDGKVQHATVPALGFQDFRDREAMFEGTAAKGGVLVFNQQTAHLENLREWPPWALGRSVQAKGLVRGGGPVWQMEKPSWRLLNLEDQIDKEVTLDGILWSLNGEWWFEYRDTKLFLIQEKGAALTFPLDRHGTIARVTGHLLRQLRPSLDQISLKLGRDLVPTFVVRGAKVELLEPIATDEERWRYVYSESIPLKDGVPVFLEKFSFRMNMMGNETSARLVIERNSARINELLRHPTAAQINVLHQRLAETTAQPVLHLLYAAVLAACHDDEGRKTLLEAVKDEESDHFPDALYFLGIVPYLPPQDSSLKPDMTWAEDTMLDLLIRKDPKPHVKGSPFSTTEENPRTLTVSEACVKYSDIAHVLLHSPSAQVRATLVNYVFSDDKVGNKLIPVLCADPTSLPVDALVKYLQKTPAAKRDSAEKPDVTSTWPQPINAGDILGDFTGFPYAKPGQRDVLEKLLRQHEPIAVPLFKAALGDSSVYTDFRSYLTPEIATALKAELPNLKDLALLHARLLVLLQEKDPVARLLPLLDAPDGPTKSLAIYELRQIKDDRVAHALAHTLHRAKEGFFSWKAHDLSATSALTNAIGGIALCGNDAALVELIDLLETSFGRAHEKYLSDADLHLIIAAQLIELTGESFGSDAKAWKKWRQEKK